MATTAWALGVPAAQVVRTTAGASALGVAHGLFVTAWVDPAAIGWPLTPFIGAFLGALAGLVTGGLLRVLLTLAARGRPLRGTVVASAVLAVAVATSLALSVMVAVDGPVSPVVMAVVVAGAAGLPAVVVLAACARQARSVRAGAT